MKAGKSKSPISTIVLYVISVIVGLVAIAFLVNDIIQFNSLVSQYVSQGYTLADVKKELIPGQLLPNIFQAVINVGIALILWGAGLINQKVWVLLKNKSVEISS